MARFPAGPIAFSLALAIAAAVPAGGVAVAAESGAGHGESAGNGPVYVRLDPITVTIFRDNRPAGIYTTALTLELAAPDQRGLVDSATSRLRDAMLRQLHVLMDREERRGTAVTIDTLKHAMRAIARRELGDDVVLDLFVHSVLRKGA